jgi:hypothetical protein
VVGVFPGEGSLVNLAKGHGRLGFPALPGHEPALGCGRETHKNHDLTGGAILPVGVRGVRNVGFKASQGERAPYLPSPPIRLPGLSGYPVESRR